MTRLSFAAYGLTAALSSAAPQGSQHLPVLRARHLAPTADVKVFHVAGSIRLIGWDRDSIVVRGRVARGDGFYFAGGDSSVKFGIENRSGTRDPSPSDLVVYLPRQAHMALKTVTANVTASDLSGWFYSVSGNLRFSGSATSLDAQTMRGDLDLDVTTPWARARTGSGHLLLRGAPQDVDVATVSGRLDFAATGVLRAQAVSVSGDIHYVGTPARGSIADFSNHSGAIEFSLPPSASGVFTLSSVSGPIENDFRQVRPAGSRTQGLRVTLGRGDSQVMVRTFKGPIRLKTQ